MMDSKEVERMKPNRQICPECGENELMQGESVCTRCMISAHREGDVNLKGI